MVVGDLRRIQSPIVDAKGLTAGATRGDAVFAWDPTNKQLLFVNLKQLYCLGFLRREGSVRISIWWWCFRCLAEDAAKCPSQSRRLADCSSLALVLLVNVMARRKQWILGLTFLSTLASCCRRRPTSCRRKDHGIETAWVLSVQSYEVGKPSEGMLNHVPRNSDWNWQLPMLRQAPMVAAV